VPNVLPRSLCSWPCTSLHLLKEGHNHPIVRFAYLCHMIGEEYNMKNALHTSNNEKESNMFLVYSCDDREN